MRRRSAFEAKMRDLQACAPEKGRAGNFVHNLQEMATKKWGNLSTAPISIARLVDS